MLLNFLASKVLYNHWLRFWIYEAFKLMLSFWHISADLKWAWSFWTLLICTEADGLGQKPSVPEIIWLRCWQDKEDVGREWELGEAQNCLMLCTSWLLTAFYLMNFLHRLSPLSACSLQEPGRMSSPWPQRCLCQTVQKASRLTRFTRTNKPPTQYTRATLIWRPKCKTNYLL